MILTGGAGSDDRDGTSYGVPILANLAGAISQAGFVAVRYDKRGYGQSGGRRESATIGDVADDVRAIVKWLTDRKDIDPKRIAVLGHGEGAWVALLAAARAINASRASCRLTRRRLPAPSSRSSSSSTRSIGSRRLPPIARRRSSCRKRFRPRS